MWDLPRCPTLFGVSDRRRLGRSRSRLRWIPTKDQTAELTICLSTLAPSANDRGGPCVIIRKQFLRRDPSSRQVVPSAVEYCCMSLSKFFRSFVIGFLGICHAFGTEQNMQIHCLAAIGVIAAGMTFSLAAWEWIAVLLCIGVVISAECMNTAIERLADRISQEKNPLIKQAKDCGSAAVLVLAIISAAVGLTIFVPKMWVMSGW